MPTPVTDVGTELLFENDVVRVWSMRLAPGEDSPYHVHTRDYLFVYTTASRIGFMERPGEVLETHDYDEGYVNFVSVGEGVSHQIRNLAETPHQQILVEFKSVRNQAPTASNGRVSGPV